VRLTRLCQYGVAVLVSVTNFLSTLAEKFEKEAAEMGKGSFKYAWVLDKLKVRCCAAIYKSS
jgi:translation elongation factor EF-1alpha